uniref:Uncharacterized protein n=1 Tax=Megaselia scalaris TaxID=36166 RepID=T1GRM1_MEGSC
MGGGPKQEQLNTKTGFLMNTFFDCLAVENKRNPNTKYLFYLALKSHLKEKDDENLDEIPMPIFINYPFDRKCLSISINGESTALAVSAIVHENLCYINIFEDPCPAFEIYNETNLNFFIAQSKSSGKSKVTEALNETDCNSFNQIQILQNL